MKFYWQFFIKLIRRGSFNSQRDEILRFCFFFDCFEFLFQFPTGWNSTEKQISLFDFSTAGFNSQRDEILQYDFCYTNINELFQFPTGWNSTIGFAANIYASYEFQFPTGWNSTIGFSKSKPFCKFQFPTGWNSTMGGKPWRMVEFCFNSQRDEILRWDLKYLEDFLAVSIPNGMKFYQNREFYPPSCQLFQFPTGWNSTNAKEAFLDVPLSFNSQRDEILRR